MWPRPDRIAGGPEKRSWLVRGTGNVDPPAGGGFLLKPELHRPIWEQGARFRRFLVPSRQSPPLSTPLTLHYFKPSMEKWQQLGYESFSAWRHAYDRERRKKLAATKLAAASTPIVRWQPSFSPISPVPSALTLLTQSIGPIFESLEASKHSSTSDQLSTCAFTRHHHGRKGLDLWRCRPLRDS